jgi:TolB protein
LTKNESRDWLPSWSPSGDKIAFWSDREGSWGIYLMDQNGNNVQELASSIITGGGGVSRPAWSPDGNHIAFNTNGNKSNEIYIMDISVDEEIRLTNSTGENYDPSWTQ